MVKKEVKETAHCFGKDCKTKRKATGHYTSVAVKGRKQKQFKGTCDTCGGNVSKFQFREELRAIETEQLDGYKLSHIYSTVCHS